MREPSESRQAEVPPPNHRERAWLARILIITGLVYCFSLRNEFVFDDDELIVHNRYLGNWAFVWKSIVNHSTWFLNPRHPPTGSYYRPMQEIWLALNFAIFGMNPIGWHAAMIALHLLVVWMVFRVARLLTADGDTALVAAALFALMPIHLETAIWPAAISQPLSTAFTLGAFEFYLRSRVGSHSEAHRMRTIAISTALFAGALFSYEGVILFPLVIGLYAAIFQSEPRNGMDQRDRSIHVPTLSARCRDGITAALPYAIASALYFGVRFLILGFLSRPNPLDAPSLSETILTIPAVLATYALMLLMPWRTGPAHQLHTVDTVASAGFYLPLIGLIALAAVSMMLLRDHPHRRLYTFCAAWILLAIVPVLDLNGIGIQSAIQDRYLHFASVAWCVIAADLAIVFVRESPQREAIARTVMAAAAVGFVIVLISVQRDWHDDVALFSRCIAQFPDGALWYNRMGMALQARGDYSAARREFESAVNYDPGDGASFYDLGLIDGRLGDFHSAEHEMAHGLDLLNYRQPAEYAQLALIADAAGDKAAAEDALIRAAAFPGGSEIAALARAQLLFRHGDIKGAQDATRNLLVQLPDDPNILSAIGAELSSEHRLEESLIPYRRAAEIVPHDPDLHFQLASAYHRLGRDSDARAECEYALSDAPNDPRPAGLLAAIERGGTAK
ncbi:MAG TPA: tetratricopeptide repeat protein [Candidatus Binataceae bacterium]|nr:tetratricopeptide repeat protein [Candidatus Binataceae bacterium]